eukprot:3687371-Prymnesium_polylepis.1
MGDNSCTTVLCGLACCFVLEYRSDVRGWMDGWHVAWVAGMDRAVVVVTLRSGLWVQASLACPRGY